MEDNKFNIRFYIRETEITDYVRELDYIKWLIKGQRQETIVLWCNKLEFIEWLLKWAEEYLQGWAEEYLKKWNEEQINLFDELVTKYHYDWESATKIVENTENSKGQAKS